MVELFRLIYFGQGRECLLIEIVKDRVGRSGHDSLFLTFYIIKM